jgi:hypothetical protein
MNSISLTSSSRLWWTPSAAAGAVSLAAIAVIAVGPAGAAAHGIPIPFPAPGSASVAHTTPTSTVPPTGTRPCYLTRMVLSSTAADEAHPLCSLRIRATLR